jgi:hypothetical protein
MRRYAVVADVLSPREFAWMTRLRGHRGEPLTWSHVELLVRVHEEEVRKALARAVVDEGLSVRSLALRVRASR